MRARTASPALKPDHRRKDRSRGDGARPHSDNTYVSQTTGTSLFVQTEMEEVTEAPDFTISPSWWPADKHGPDGQKIQILHLS